MESSVLQTRHMRRALACGGSSCCSDASGQAAPRRRDLLPRLFGFALSFDPPLLGLVLARDASRMRVAGERVEDVERRQHRVIQAAPDPSHRSHNPKVAGSNPAPAKRKPCTSRAFGFLKATGFRCGFN
jgi:hypothetical protein